jgi:hypothetical protein
MKTFLKVAVVGLLISLSACSGTSTTSTSTIDLPTIAPNLPQPPALENVTFHVYDANDLTALVASNPNVILFTLTQDQNLIMADNLAELQRYITQLQQALTYYQNLSVPAKN